MYETERVAAERVTAELAKPIPAEQYHIGVDEFFDPWRLFPVYGSYSSEFDECAIEVLDELIAGERKRSDLGADMFREMLCTANLCEYGTSPRVCFPSQAFKPLLPELRAKWEAYYAVQWGEPYAA